MTTFRKVLKIRPRYSLDRLYHHFKYLSIAFRKIIAKKFKKYRYLLNLFILCVVSSQFFLGLITALQSNDNFFLSAHLDALNQTANS